MRAHRLESIGEKLISTIKKSDDLIDQHNQMCVGSITFHDHMKK